MSKHSSIPYVSLAGEIWKDIPNYEGLYQASNLGRVRSLPRILYRSGSTSGKGTWMKRPIRGRILKQLEDHNGRMFVRLCCGDGGRNLYVHRLVLMAFSGPCPVGMESCHRDSNCKNNRIENLRWDTHLENQRDEVRNGTKKGEKSSYHKLTNGEIKEIRNLWDTGKYSRTRLGRMYRVTAANIWCIIRRKSWSHI